MTSKSPRLLVAAATVWIVVGSFASVTWLRDFRLDLLSLLSLIAALVWWVVLLWSLHNLAFQIQSVIERPAPRGTNGERPRVAVLYTTCDDFNEAACRSCVDQDYGEDFFVLVLDDSRETQSVAAVKEFCEQFEPTRCRRIDREDKSGFKAGNLNNALSGLEEEWVLLVDADQVLDQDFLSLLVRQLPEDSSDLAFVQAANAASLSAEPSIFERLMSLAVPFYYRRDLPARQRFGFVPLLGHGALVSTSAWTELQGGFPKIVSEDLGFALQCAAAGRSGRFVAHPEARELYPFDFGGFVLRLRKYAAGTAELRIELRNFWRSGAASFVERWDATMQMLWYALMPLIVLNGFLTAYVLHRLWEAHVPYLHLVLPFLYLWMVFTLVLLFLSVSRRPAEGMSFYFWSTAVHAAVMPVAAVAFVQHLFRRPTSFPVTPKNGDHQNVALTDTILTIAVGCLALAAALAWRSPFSPVLAGHGVAYLCYPLYGQVCRSSRLAALARLTIYIPGLLMLVGLITMWEAVGFRWGPITTFGLGVVVALTVAWTTMTRSSDPVPETP